MGAARSRLRGSSTPASSTRSGERTGYPFHGACEALLEEALPHLQEAVRLAREHGYPDLGCLSCVALAAAQSGDAERAAILLVAHERMVSLRTHSAASSTTAEMVTRTRIAITEALDERSIAATDIAGKELSMSAAFDLASEVLTQVMAVKAMERRDASTETTI